MYWILHHYCVASLSILITSDLRTIITEENENQQLESIYKRYISKRCNLIVQLSRMDHILIHPNQSGQQTITLPGTVRGNLLPIASHIYFDSSCRKLFHNMLFQSNLKFGRRSQSTLFLQANVPVNAQSSSQTRHSCQQISLKFDQTFTYWEIFWYIYGVGVRPISGTCTDGKSGPCREQILLIRSRRPVDREAQEAQTL